MKKKIISIITIIIMLLAFTSCGSVDNSGGNKKDDLSDVIRFERFVKTNSIQLPAPINDKENLEGLYTNMKLYKSEEGKYFTGPVYEDSDLDSYELDNDKRYFTDLHITQDRLDDGSGNFIHYLEFTQEMYDNWKPDDKLFNDGIDDFFAYCQKNDIPYVLYEKNEEDSNMNWAEILLCISPDDFFDYELLPNLTYTICLVDEEVDEQWDYFVKNHN